MQPCVWACAGFCETENAERLSVDLSSETVKHVVCCVSWEVLRRAGLGVGMSVPM